MLLSFMRVSSNSLKAWVNLRDWEMLLFCSFKYNLLCLRQTAREFLGGRTRRNRGLLRWWPWPAKIKHMYVNSTVLLGYCDNGYCDKLLIVNHWGPKRQFYTVKSSVTVTILSFPNSVTITEKDCNNKKSENVRASSCDPPFVALAALALARSSW